MFDFLGVPQHITPQGVWKSYTSICVATVEKGIFILVLNVVVVWDSNKFSEPQPRINISFLIHLPQIHNEGSSDSSKCVL